MNFGDYLGGGKFLTRQKQTGKKPTKKTPKNYYESGAVVRFTEHTNSP